MRAVRKVVVVVTAAAVVAAMRSKQLDTAAGAAARASASSVAAVAAVVPAVNGLWAVSLRQGLMKSLTPYPKLEVLYLPVTAEQMPLASQQSNQDGGPVGTRGPGALCRSRSAGASVCRCSSALSAALPMTHARPYQRGPALRCDGPPARRGIADGACA